MAVGIRDGKGSILKNTDALFTELAENYPSDQYTSFCNEFGVRYNQAERIRTDQHLGNLTKALKQILNKWVDDGEEVTRQKIESALKNARTGGLISIVRRHFEKYAEVEESREEVGTSQSDASQPKNTARSNTGTNIAMAGSISNKIPYFASQTAEKRKRKAEGSDGATTKKRPKKESMPMTKRHRQILEKTAPDILDDLDTDDVLPHLLGDGVITTDDVANVNSKSTRKDQVSTLLDILPRRGDRAFDAFLKSLGKTKGSSHLYQSVKKLEETYIEQVALEEMEPISQTSKYTKYNETPRYKESALTGLRPRLEGKEEIERTVSAASTSSAESPPQPVLCIDNYRSEGTFDYRGGQLTISSQGLTLFIPRGALPKDTITKIRVEVLRDIPTNIALRDDEMIATSGFQCHPSGLYFQVGKPVRLRIVHCANLIDPQKVQTVLYSWSHVAEDGSATEKLERTVQTSRNCRVTPNYIEISLEHFSGGILAFILNWWHMKGKLMSFMPFLPRTMPSSRRVIMELRMVNKPRATYWKNVHAVDKIGHYQAAKDDDDVMIVKQEDLHVELQLGDTMIDKRVSSENLRKTKHTLYFNMDLSKKSDESLVVLNLEQSSCQMDIQFMTYFYEHAAEFDSSSSGKDEIEGTSDSASDNNVSESELERFVDELGDHEDVGKLALKFGFRYSKWQAYRKMNKDGGFDGTRRMLFDWKKRTPKQEQRWTLRKVLEESGFGEAAENL